MTAERAARVVAALAFCYFLLVDFRAGWNRAETDFPNYYTAAVLVRKGEPLHKYYDWTWFQRQMNYAGIERQLGSYVPQTPATMLPIVPFAFLPVQQAKRVWLVLNLGFLAGTIWLLSRITRLSLAQVVLVAFAGHGTLASNFLLGQYYVFLLFLLTLAFFFLYRGREVAGGVLIGLAFILKLYAGPFFLFFAVRRRWRALTASVLGTVGFIGVTICLFGWSDVAYFGQHVLPRALAGDLIDPYNAGYQTLAALLRRTFLAEPELNPHPTWNAPQLYFFLAPLFTLALLAVPLICANTANRKRDFAWFCVAIVLVSTSMGSYSFILLLLPVILLLDEASWAEGMIVLICYVVGAMPLRAAWVPLFPKLWVVLLLYFVAGRASVQAVRPWRVLTAAVPVLIAVCVVARLNFESYQREPGRRWERILTEPMAISSSSPAIVCSGLVYQSIGRLHYELAFLRGGHVEHFPFDGEAVRPMAASACDSVSFELVSQGRSRRMLFNPITKNVGELRGNTQEPELVSPDGKVVAFVCSSGGNMQICLRRTAGGGPIQLTGGRCNSYDPAWELDSAGIVFASDCDRGLGLPALYRARVANIKMAATIANTAAAESTNE